jgi:hypothetical protein
MKINLWYSQHQKEWRWTLVTEEEPMSQESGGRIFLRDAMDDIANTVEYILDKKQS